MTILENELLRIEIETLGAQLTRIFHKQEEIDYLWDANPTYWGRHAPILFPIVGRLAENQYFYNGESYEMGQHGFARDQEFTLIEVTTTQARFQLQANEISRKKYPFEFLLEIVYTLQADKLTIDWYVQNTDDKKIYFAIGAHPAFSTKLLPNDQFSDYSLEFTQPEDLTAMLLDPSQGLFSGEVSEVTSDSESLALNYDLFVNDALVFNNFQGGVMTLKCKNHNHGLTYDFTGFPYVAIWTPPGKAAPFICLEPWYGYADTIEGPFELQHKPAMQMLNSKETFKSQQTLTFF